MTKLDFLTQLCQVREDLETLRLEWTRDTAEQVETTLLALGARLDALIDAVPALEER